MLIALVLFVNLGGKGIPKVGDTAVAIAAFGRRTLFAAGGRLISSADHKREDCEAGC